MRTTMEYRATLTQFINYTNPSGQKLQAAIFLPANYEPGKSYPTLVYMYEKLTDGLNRYSHCVV